MYIYTVKATAQCNTMKTPNSFSWSFSFYLNEIHVKSLCNMRMYTTRILHGGAKIWILLSIGKTIFYERAQRVSKILFCHAKIKFISSSRRVMFFLLYRHADDGVSDDFPKISDRLPKISEDFPKLFRIPDEVAYGVYEWFSSQ